MCSFAVLNILRVRGFVKFSFHSICKNVSKVFKFVLFFWQQKQQTLLHSEHLQ